LLSADVPITSKNSIMSKLSSLRSKKGKTSIKPKAVFADAEEMKRVVRLACSNPPYNVQDFYWDDGFWQQIARHTCFENITLFVIATNSIWIAIDTDYNDAEVLNDADLHFQVVENLYCVYFFIEFVIRFMAFKSKPDCIRDPEFLFDTALVTLTVVETWLIPLLILFGGSGGEGGGNASFLRLFRLLRLTRMGRMVRLLRAFPELMILLKGMKTATRSVFCTLVILMVFIYVFAVGFKMLSKGTRLQDDYFGSTFGSMSTLLISGCMPDLADIISDLGEEHILYGLVFGFFILLTTLTVMNMLVGVLCEVVSIVSAVEKEQMEVTFVKDKLKEVLLLCEGYNDEIDRITKVQFQELLAIPEAARALHQVGVDAAGLVDYIDIIFLKSDKSDEIDFADFMEIILELRGGNKATVKDVVDLRKFNTSAFNAVGEKIAALEAQVCEALGQNQKAKWDTLQVSRQGSSKGTSSLADKRSKAKKLKTSDYDDDGGDLS